MKKIFIVMILSFILLFSFSILASAEPFPNSVVNMLNYKAFRTGTTSGVNFALNGDSYILNGVADADISFIILSTTYFNSDADQLYILYGGSDDSQVSVKYYGGQVDIKSSDIPSVFKLPLGSLNVAFYIYIPKGTVLKDVTIRPLFSVFKYTVYSYGTDISNQTNLLYKDGYSVGYDVGLFEGETKGKEEGIAEGYTLGKGDGYELGSANGELVGYIDGYRSGYQNYKISSEYKIALEESYALGFDEGEASVEQEQENYIFTILLPITVIACVLCVGLIIFKSVNKKRRKKK